MREFVCKECERVIYSFGYDDGTDVCGACQTVPGWWKIPELRARIDPEREDDDRRSDQAQSVNSQKVGSHPDIDEGERG